MPASKPSAERVEHGEHLGQLQVGQGPEVLKCRQRLRVQPDEIGEVLFEQLQPFQTGGAVSLVLPIVLLFP